MSKNQPLTPNPQPPFFFKLWPLLIFTFALAIRLLFLTQFETNPFFYPIVKGVDPSLYHEWAQELARGYWPGDKMLFGHPFYPFILSFIYRFWGVETYSVRVLQVLMGSASVALLYFIAKAVFNRRSAMIASVLAALYAPFLFYEGLLMPSALSIFLNLAGILMLLNIINTPNTKRTFLAGLLLGCSLAANSAILPFLIAIILWIALKKWGQPQIPGEGRLGQSPFFHAVVLIIGICLPLSFLMLKHYTVEGNLNLFGAHGGINFYVGNNPGADGTFKAPCGFTPSARGLSEDSSRYAQEALARPVSPGEASDFWYGKAFEWIRRDPVSWAALLLRKFMLFFNNAELSDVADYYLCRKSSPLLRYNPLGFGLIIPFGLIGMYMARRSLNRSFVLYAGFMSYLISGLLFFVNSRYRLPAVPFILIFSGVAIDGCWRNIEQKRIKKLVFFLAALSGLFLFTSLRLVSADTVTPRYNLSVIYEKKGLYDLAIAESDKLLKADYNMPYVHFNRGVCLYQKKDTKEAIKAFNNAVRCLPDYHDAHFNLGLIYSQNKDFKNALKEFNILLLTNKNDIAAIYNIGAIYEKQGDYERALQEYYKVLRLNPGLIEAQNAYRRVKERPK